MVKKVFSRRRKSQADRKFKTRRAKQQLKEQVQSHFSKNFYLKIKNEQNSKNNFPQSISVLCFSILWRIFRNLCRLYHVRNEKSDCWDIWHVSNWYTVFSVSDYYFFRVCIINRGRLAEVKFKSIVRQNDLRNILNTFYSYSFSLGLRNFGIAELKSGRWPNKEV